MRYRSSVGMSTFRYRYFCGGVLLTSICWCFLIVIYSSHLEKVAKQSSMEQRAMMQESMQQHGVIDSQPGHRNVPFPDMPLDRQQWPEPWNKKVPQRGQKRVKVHGHYHVVEDTAADGPDYEKEYDEETNQTKEKQRQLQDYKQIRPPPGEKSKRKFVLPEGAALNREEGERQVPQPPSPVEPEVDLAELAKVSTEQDQARREFGYHKFAFNVLLSDRIGERRAIVDTRHELCQAQVYSSNLSKASIIICFYNEAPSALIRLVNSILDRTDHSLIEEILLIDDLSQTEVNISAVHAYAQKHWNDYGLVRFLKTEKREGLIRAKIFGASKAKGEVIVFLDSHCEVNKQWLPPLLDRIKQDPKTVACPIIDIIEPDTFKYVGSPVCFGGMQWSLLFKWDYPPASHFKTPADYIKPLKSPTMAGGLFAMRRDYFHELGEYDAEQSSITPKAKRVISLTLLDDADNLCLSAQSGHTPTRDEAVTLSRCDPKDSKHQSWHETEDGELRIAGINMCLDAQRPTMVRLAKCSVQGAFQLWQFKSDNTLYNPATGMCLSRSKDNDGDIVVTMCSDALKWSPVVSGGTSRDLR